MRTAPSYPGTIAAPESTMIWTIIAILLILWILGLVTKTLVGGVLHILLVIAIILIVVRLVSGRRVV
jgi:hypothetical protein